MSYREMIFIFLFIILPFLTKATDNYSIGDKLYVWANVGLILREKPDANATKIGKLTYGNEVIVLGQKLRTTAHKVLEIKHELPNTKDFYMKGHWVLVSFKGKKGYVFDAYLLKLKPIKHREEILKWLKRNYVFKNVKIKKENGSREHTYSFENGVVFFTHSSNYSEEKTTLIGITQQDAVLIIQQVTQGKATISKTNELIYHHDECESNIEKGKNKIIINTVCSC